MSFPEYLAGFSSGDATFSERSPRVPNSLARLPSYLGDVLDPAGAIPCQLGKLLDRLGAVTPKLERPRDQK